MAFLVQYLAACVFCQTAFCGTLSYFPRTLDIACKQLRSSNCSGYNNWTSRCQTETKAGDITRRRKFNIMHHIERKTWYEAWRVCVSHNRSLVMPKTKETEDLLRTKSRIGTGFWLGLRKRIDGMYMWLDGDPLTYSNWVKGEPRGKESCSTYHATFWGEMQGWTEENCVHKRPFFCQY